MTGIKIIYHFDVENRKQIPFHMVTIVDEHEFLTLGEFKSITNRHRYRFFFLSYDEEFGLVKEEFYSDDDILPTFGGRIEAWLFNDGCIMHRRTFNTQEDSERRRTTTYHSNTKQLRLYNIFSSLSDENHKFDENGLLPISEADVPNDARCFHSRKQLQSINAPSDRQNGEVSSRTTINDQDGALTPMVIRKQFPNNCNFKQDLVKTSTPLKTKTGACMHDTRRRKPIQCLYQPIPDFITEPPELTTQYESTAAQERRENNEDLRRLGIRSTTNNIVRNQPGNIDSYRGSQSTFGLVKQRHLEIKKHFSSCSFKTQHRRRGPLLEIRDYHHHSKKRVELSLPKTSFSDSDFGTFIRKRECLLHDCSSIIDVPLLNPGNLADSCISLCEFKMKESDECVKLDTQTRYASIFNQRTHAISLPNTDGLLDSSPSLCEFDKCESVDNNISNVSEQITYHNRKNSSSVCEVCIVGGSFDSDLSDSVRSLCSFSLNGSEAEEQLIVEANKTKKTCCRLH